ncbi:MAG TPA: hypothetical protein VFS05_07585 [Gemmatimonadaceae bacterium]|nr:hypothetical protein [Gemmatimonadaceae bacterium]
MTAPAAGGARVVEHAVCLGCGCGCDDIAVVVRDGRIAEARNACPRGRAWFGNGEVPARILVRGEDAPLDRALDEAASLLARAARPLVLLAADISCETQRAAAAIADRLHALLDGDGTSAALPSVLAAQRRGIASATLGELRNRADVVLFWGTDPAARHPRWRERFLEPEGLQVGARASRTLVAVDVGERRGPADADARVTVAPERELALLDDLRAALRGRALPDGATDARTLAERLSGARYLAIVYDAERAEGAGGAAPMDAMTGAREEGLVALAQALNDVTRCALSALRAGGNRVGAEVVLTWQTGFPMAVDFARGWPRYRPEHPALAALAAGEVDAALLLGDARAMPRALAERLAGVPSVVVGPRASEAPVRPLVAVDTGVAGIHEGGSAVRMDDVPLPLRPALRHDRSALAIARALGDRLSETGVRDQGSGERA